MGGVEIARTGAQILFEASKISVVGFFEVVSHLKDIYAAQRKRCAGGSWSRDRLC